MKQLATPEQDLYYATRFKVIDQPAGNINLLRFRAANAPSYSSLATFYVTSTGRIGMRNDVTAISTTSTAVAPRGVWHTLQAHVVVNGSGNLTEVWLDGTPIPALSATNVSFGIFTGMGQVELSAKPSGSSTYDVAFDEVAYDRQPIGDATPPTRPAASRSRLAPACGSTCRGPRRATTSARAGTTSTATACRSRRSAR